MPRPNNILARVLLYELEAAFIHCHYMAELTNAGERPPRSEQDLLGRHAGRALAKAAAAPLERRPEVISHYLRFLPPELMAAARAEVEEALVLVDQSATSEDAGLQREVLYQVCDESTGWWYRGQPDLSGWQGKKFVMVEEKRGWVCYAKYWAQLYFAAFVWSYSYWLEQKRLNPEKAVVFPEIELIVRCYRSRHGKRLWEYRRTYVPDINRLLSKKRSICLAIDRSREHEYFRPRVSPSHCQSCDRRDSCPMFNAPHREWLRKEVAKLDVELADQRARERAEVAKRRSGEQPPDDLKPVA